MGYSEERAWAVISEEFDKILERRQEKASAVLRLELQRLDVLHKTLWKQAKGGDLKAIDRLLKIAERRAALLGLDIKRHEVKVDQTYEVNVSARIDEYANELDRLAAQQRALPCGAQGNGRRKSVDPASPDV
jgi:hypothetical protein